MSSLISRKRLVIFFASIALIIFFVGYWYLHIRLPDGDPDNGGLVLPDGFRAVVVVDSVGRGRHLAVRENGDVYMKLRGPDSLGRGSVALRDTDNDGKADIVTYFGDYADSGFYGNAMRIHNGYLYFATAGEVYRTRLDPNTLVPTDSSECMLVDNYKRAKFSHIAKPITPDSLIDGIDQLLAQAAQVEAPAAISA